MSPSGAGVGFTRVTPLVTIDPVRITSSAVTPELLMSSSSDNLRSVWKRRAGERLSETTGDDIVHNSRVGQGRDVA